MRTLIVYATHDGQTEKISQRIARRLRGKHFPVDLYNVARAPDKPVSLDAYDAVIVGSPVHYSHYDVRLAEYLSGYREPLREIPSAFFSVSLGIISPNKSEQEEIQKITDAYLREAGWKPPIKIHFGGAIRYSKYGWFKRWLVRLIVKEGGSSTEIQRDHEFTDWEQVDRFAEEFMCFVNSCRQSNRNSEAFACYAKPTRRYSIQHRHGRVMGGG